MPVQSSLKTIFFRVDASVSIGTGHLSRCKNLARFLKSRGCRILFLCRDHSDSLHQSLLDSDFEYLTLPRRSSGLLSETDSSYLGWLGCSEEQDANDCWELIKTRSTLVPDFIVVDHYAISSIWETRISSYWSSAKLLAIDDLANRSHCVDFLIDSGRLGSFGDSGYQDLLDNHVVTLFGPFFSLLTSDYLEFRQSSSTRHSLGRILVFFGGVDSSNVTLVALQALLESNLQGINVDVVLGNSAPHLNQVKAFVSQIAGWKLHIGMPSLAPLVNEADLALGAGGVHSWERACLGLPAITTPVADNQLDLLAGLSTCGAITTITQSKSSDLLTSFCEQLEALQGAHSQLSDMSEAAFILLDGYGVNRVAALMLGIIQPVFLRPACDRDLGLYFWWCNDPTVRQSSLQVSSITLEEHKEWFMDSLSSSLALLRLLVDSDGLPLGQIRFVRTENDLNRVVVSFSIDRLFRGQGLASKLLNLGLTDLARTWRDVAEVKAYVKCGNEPSARVFLSTGFQEQASPELGLRYFLKPLRS